MSTITRIWAELRARYAARHEPENIRPLAELYWRGLLALALATIAGILMWGLWTFVDVVSTVSSAPASSGTPPAVLDRKTLEATLEAYTARESAFNELKASPKSYSDPSK